MTLFLSGVLRLAASGIILGAALTIVMRAWFASLLGGNGIDTMALSISALLLFGAATLATLIPATRASRIDPMQALRSE